MDQELLELVISFLITAAMSIGVGFLLQWMGSQGILFALPVANRYGLVVMRGGAAKKGETEEETEEVTGAVIDVIHAIPGKRLVRVNEDGEPETDEMKWYFEDGVEERDELFKLLGIVWLGPYKTLRKNKVRSFRFGRKDSDTEYSIMNKTEDAPWVHYSAQQDIAMKSVETKDILAANYAINVPFVDKYPVRARLLVADSIAVMTLMVQEEVIDVVGGKKIETAVRDRHTKDEIVDKVSGISENIETETGLSIKKPNIFEVSMDARTREIMEMQAKAVREAKKKVIDAKGEKRARILYNDAEADHIERNVNPRARNEYTTRVTESENLRDSKITHNVNVKVG